MLRRGNPAHLLLAAAGIWLLLGVPHMRAWLESSMVLHMLVQLPLLAWIGYCSGRAWLRSSPAGGAGRALGVVQSFNGGGVTGILCASFVMVLWMLPRLLDLARLDDLAAAIKFLCLPFAGCAVALSWQRLPAIARGVVHLEVIATLLRFGWGYLASDQRLCLAYLAEDQQVAGQLLLWLGGVYAACVVWRPMFGVVLRARPVPG